jgi:ribosomal protein S6
VSCLRPWGPAAPAAARRRLWPDGRRVATVRGHDHPERGHVDFWGKRRLAYEINRKADGYYVVFQARSEPPAMVELSRVLSLADEVIRHKVLRIPAKVYGPPKVAGPVADRA